MTAKKQNQIKSNHPAPENLSALLDNELPADQADQIFEHLNHCDNCRLQYQELKDISTQIRSIKSSFSIPPESLSQRFDFQFTSSPVRQSPGYRLFLYTTKYAALAAVFLLALLFFRPQPLSRQSISEPPVSLESRSQKSVPTPASDFPTISSESEQFEKIALLERSAPPPPAASTAPLKRSHDFARISVQESDLLFADGLQEEFSEKKTREEQTKEIELEKFDESVENPSSEVSIQ